MFQDIKMFKMEKLPPKSGIEEFLIHCLKICWTMVLQTPPMRFVYPERGSKFDDKIHQLFYDSKSSATKMISHAVHPALYHGETLMHPASVMLL